MLMFYSRVNRNWLLVDFIFLDYISFWEKTSKDWCILRHCLLGIVWLCICISWPGLQCVIMIAWKVMHMISYLLWRRINKNSFCWRDFKRIAHTHIHVYPNIHFKFHQPYHFKGKLSIIACYKNSFVCFWLRCLICVTFDCVLSLKVQ